MIVNLSPLTHIEITVNDAEAAFQVLNKTLGAIKVQEELAALLGGEGAIDIHVGLGDVVFQFVQPKIKVGSWSDQLKNNGPGVHNITFGVDNFTYYGLQDVIYGDQTNFDGATLYADHAHALVAVGGLRDKFGFGASIWHINKVVCHEFGHLLVGLSHLEDSCSIMDDGDSFWEENPECFKFDGEHVKKLRSGDFFDEL